MQEPNQTCKTIEDIQKTLNTIKDACESLQSAPPNEPHLVGVILKKLQQETGKLPGSNRVKTLCEKHIPENQQAQFMKNMESIQTEAYGIIFKKI